VFVANDLSQFHIPLRFLYRNALRAGDSLLWTPSLFAGFALHGEGQLGMFHPLHLAIYWCLPLDVAFNLEIIASYVAAYAGMYWLLRRLDLSSRASLFGAMLFAFSGFQLLHFVHVNVVAIVAHIPWMLVAIDVLARARTRGTRVRGLCAVSFILASALLLGFPQAVWWMFLAASWFVAFHARDRSRLGALLWCVPAVIAGAALGAIQVLPTLDHVVHSMRAQQSRDFALTYSLYPWNVLQLWSPYGFLQRVIYPFDIPWEHELGVYCGATAPIALAWLWIRRGALGSWRPLMRWAAALAAVAFVLALGRYGLLDVLLTYLPGLGSLRAPVRYIVLVQFALALLSALAFHDVLSLDRPWPMRRPDLLILWAPAALSILTVAFLNMHVLPVGAHLPLASIADASYGPAIFVGLTLAVMRAADGRGWAPLLIVALAAVDLGTWGLGYVTRQPALTIEQMTGGLPRAADRTRIACPTYCGDDRPLLKNYDMVEAYVALFPATVLPFYSHAFQELAGTRLELQPSGWLIPVADPLPRARLLRDVRVSTDVMTDIRTIDLRRTALVARPLQTAGTEGTANVTLDRPGHIIVETASLGVQLLSLTERYDAGWTAFVDDRAEPVLPVNGDFIGIAVGSGTHHVEFRYAPRSFTRGCQLSALGCAGLLLTALLAARRPANRQDVARRGDAEA
jgi:membrane protein YfhO